MDFMGFRTGFSTLKIMENSTNQGSKLPVSKMLGTDLFGMPVYPDITHQEEPSLSAPVEDSRQGTLALGLR